MPLKIDLSNTSAGKFVKESLNAYDEHGMLNKFYTTLSVHSNSYNTYPALAKKLLNNRHIALSANASVKNYPYKELIRIGANKALSAANADRVWEWAELSFDKWVAANLRSMLPKVDAVHVYEHSALSTLLACRAQGIVSIYEQPSLHHHFKKPIIEEQLRLYPELESNYNQLLINNLSNKRDKRRDIELQQADIVLCNSMVTRHTLVKAGKSANDIVVVPLGFPKPNIERLTVPNTKVRFLHAGNQSIIKGSHLLYITWEKYFKANNDAELIVVGDQQLPEKFVGQFRGNIQFMNRLPFDELQQLISSCQVIVFPSLGDGFGQIITESMAKGKVVIASNHCAGPDLIQHQINGLITQAGDVDHLAQQIKWCITNKHHLDNVGNNAADTASNYQWQDYRKLLVDMVTDQIQTRKKNV